MKRTMKKIREGAQLILAQRKVTSQLSYGDNLTGAMPATEHSSTTNLHLRSPQQNTRKYSSKDRPIDARGPMGYYELVTTHICWKLNKVKVKNGRSLSLRLAVWRH
jgi:hypothetical protein